LANIILVYPITGLDVEGVSVWLPLSILHVASTLVNDYSVCIVDQRVDHNWKKTITHNLTDDTICIGISSMTGTQIRHGLEAACFVRKINPEIPIVWGGIHPTLSPEITVANDFVDIVVMGEGEITFRKLVDRLWKKKSIKDLENICFIEDGKTVKNGTGTEPSNFIDRNSLPDLPYDLIEVEKYVCNKTFSGMKIRSLPYISSFGCAYNCAFCCQPILSNRKWRAQKPKLVAERIFSLKEKFSLDAIEFYDEEFFTNRKRGLEIASLIDNNFLWYVQTRMDDLLHLDLHYLSKKGLRAVQPGIETGSSRILKLINKAETLDDFIQANRLLAKTEIKAIYNFMIGFPTESIEDIKASTSLALTLLKENGNAYIAGFYVYVPYPGAKLFSLAVNDGFVPPATLDEWAKYSRHHLESPWVKKNKKMYQMLMFTSKFIDMKRIKNSFDRFPYNLVVERLSNRYLSKWKKKDFRNTYDVKIPFLLTRRFFS